MSTRSRLDGKFTIVTGAARGIGRAYASRLAGLGAKLVVEAVMEHASRPAALGMLLLAEFSAPWSNPL